MEQLLLLLLLLLTVPFIELSLYPSSIVSSSPSMLTKQVSSSGLMLHSADCDDQDQLSDEMQSKQSMVWRNDQAAWKITTVLKNLVHLNLYIVGTCCSNLL